LLIVSEFCAFGGPYLVVYYRCSKNFGVSLYVPLNFDEVNAYAQIFELNDTDEVMWKKRRK